MFLFNLNFFIVFLFLSDIMCILYFKGELDEKFLHNYNDENIKYIT